MTFFIVLMKSSWISFAWRVEVRDCQHVFSWVPEKLVWISGHTAHAARLTK